ncbi:MAG: hypothetical protein JO116_09560 [Planctomycetaceae bacterium]|nr:hypothetical protein [Planctomycetaceae bacterium]
MSYAVELTSPAAAKIAGWSLSRHLQSEILKGLDRLTSNPSQSLIRVGPPHDVLQFDLVVHEPGNPPLAYLFVLTVFYATDEETLVIKDCEYDSQEVGPE